MRKVTLEAVVIWMALAFITGFAAYILYKRGRMHASTAIILPVLVFYLSFILTITVIERRARRKARYKLELFWSYKKAFSGAPQLLWENFWNVVLFIPLGLMGAVLMKKHPWLAVLFGMLLSAGIELTQLLTHRGLFEFDDIFHNTLGATIGVGLYLLLRRIERKL